MTNEHETSWVRIGEYHELRTRDGGVFGVVSPGGDGSFEWRLASPSFASRLGPSSGSCRQRRHALRSVERIRSAHVASQPRRYDYTRLADIDTVIETVCAAFGAEIFRDVVVGDAEADFTYTASRAGEEAVVMEFPRLGTRALERTQFSAGFIRVLEQRQRLSGAVA